MLTTVSAMNKPSDVMLVIFCFRAFTETTSANHPTKWPQLRRESWNNESRQGQSCCCTHYPHDRWSESTLTTDCFQRTELCTLCNKYDSTTLATAKSVMIKTYTVPWAVEFWHEPRNLSVAVEFPYFSGILQNCLFTWHKSIKYKS